mmetsp:Transcript_27031/g.31192  ORF Transcript_27031/g.31192 Transcript_27031/m.31192 type:complete len:312 (+) Transcript_27031:33-968(+)
METTAKPEGRLRSKSTGTERAEWLLFEKLFGLFCTCATVILYAVMIACSQIAFRLNDRVNCFGYLLVKSVSMIVLVSVLTLYLDVKIFRIDAQARTLLVVRSLIGVTGVPMFFLIFQYMIMSRTAAVINYSKSLLVAVVAFFVFREPFTKLNLVASVGAYVGVGFYAFGKPAMSDATPEAFWHSHVIFAAVSSVSTGVVVLMTRAMNKHLHFVYSPFYYSWFLFAACVAGSYFYPDEFSLASYEFFDITAIFTCGLLSLSAECLMSLGLKYEGAGIVAPIICLELVVHEFSNVLVFGHNWTVYDAIGCAMI